MKITVEVNPERGEMITNLKEISQNGQISGLKKFSGREAFVVILPKSKTLLRRSE